MSPKPTVVLTEKDKEELDYISDSAFFETFRAVSNLIAIYSIPIEDISLSKFSCKKCYLVLTPLFEKETFTYVSAKDVGFNVGINCIEKITMLRGAAPKGKFTPGGSFVLSHDSKVFSFTPEGAKKRGLIAPLTLEEENYLLTWFLITKDNYKLCCNLV